MGSLSLFSYCAGTPDFLNDPLSKYGPENCTGHPKGKKRANHLNRKADD